MSSIDSGPPSAKWCSSPFSIGATAISRAEQFGIRWQSPRRCAYWSGYNITQAFRCARLHRPLILLTGWCDWDLYLILAIAILTGWDNFRLAVQTLIWLILREIVPHASTTPVRMNGKAGIVSFIHRSSVDRLACRQIRQFLSVAWTIRWRNNSKLYLIPTELINSHILLIHHSLFLSLKKNEVKSIQTKLLVH